MNKKSRGFPQGSYKLEERKTWLFKPGKFVKNAIFLVILFLLVLIQKSFLPLILPWGVSPNLVLAITIGLVVSGQVKNALWVALVGGILMDLLGLGMFGRLSLGLVISVVLVENLSGLFRKSLVLAIPPTFLASLVTRIITSFPTLLPKFLLLEAAFTCGFFMVFFPIVSWFKNRFLTEGALQLGFKI